MVFDLLLRADPQLRLRLDRLSHGLSYGVFKTPDPVTVTHLGLLSLHHRRVHRRSADSTLKLVSWRPHIASELSQ